MDRRKSGWGAIPLGLVLGGLAGLVLGTVLGDTNQWMNLGAGGGLVLGVAIGSAIENQHSNKG